MCEETRLKTNTAILFTLCCLKDALEYATQFAYATNSQGFNSRLLTRQRTLQVARS